MARLEELFFVNPMVVIEIPDAVRSFSGVSFPKVAMAWESISIWKLSSHFPVQPVVRLVEPLRVWFGAALKHTNLRLTSPSRGGLVVTFVRTPPICSPHPTPRRTFWFAPPALGC